jgi:ribosomal protein S18 acetylase RimI-like enzyme
LIKIIKVQPEETTDLRTISRSTFYETFKDSNSEEDMNHYLENDLSLSQLEDELKNPISEFYFAKEGELIVGYLKITFHNGHELPQSEKGMEIERVYVSKNYLGTSVGKVLLEKSILSAQENNCNYIWLGVWEHNQRAILFYEKNGFVKFGIKKFKLGCDIQTDFLMKLDLN